jgi:aminoglycoside phosphotransferase (APT) family kinase protein
VHWFRTDWQRGGAATGYATFRQDDGRDHPVVVKLPVPPIERFWLARLQDHDHVVPRLYAHGDSLNGYDFAWVVMERMPFGPLGHHWDGQEFDLLVDAVCRFYQASHDVPVEGPPPPRKDWEAILKKARHNVHESGIVHEQRWNTALKRAGHKLDKWLNIWHAMPCDHWCHGDLHFGNAMTRVAPPQGPAVLLDFACAAPGSWVQDAIYLEHLFWGHPQRLAGRKLCSMMAKRRKALGLPLDPDWPRYAEIRRCLLAMSVPAMMQHEGDPTHAEAALEILETATK